MAATVKKLNTRWMNVWQITDGETVAFVSQSKNRAADSLPSYAAGKAGRESFSPVSEWVETFDVAAELAVEAKRRFMKRVIVI